MKINSSYTRGLLAELWAMAYLLLKGYQIRAWRYKTPVGEIDIIASRGKTLIFAEVKQRGDIDKASGAVTPPYAKPDQPDGPAFSGTAERENMGKYPF